MTKILFAAGAAIIVLAGLFLYLKPVFSVNGEIIFRPEFEKNLVAAQSAQKKFQDKNPGLPSSMDLEAPTAERILTAHLVHAELWREVDSKTLSPLLQNKVNPALQNPSFLAAAQDFYGLDAQSVKDYVVTPQAEEDILKSELMLRGVSFSDWLLGAKKSAKVKIYFSDLRWNGSDLVKG